MDLKIELENKVSSASNELIGSAFLSDDCLSDHTLRQKTINLSTRFEIIDLLASLSGFFSFVYYDKCRIIASVDIVRSKPIFYSTVANSIVFSDSISTTTFGEQYTLSTYALEEFKLSGF